MSTKRTFSHLSATGEAKMVNVAQKPDQARRATAEGFVRGAAATVRLLKKQALPKGDVFSVARIAAIQGAKSTATLIPLCHPLPIHGIEIDLKLEADGVRIRATVETIGKTGVEMEALTAVSIAGLTIYDMCKAVDKGMVIESVRLVEKIKS
ncbi:MAG: cyclic pyranopterin monophosphate synthase MoaC [Verrucomicrobiota bacterium]|nr:cyclic pyranopterin monophosphate synthase MoaC [Verrucomicrobiota bacterium]